MKRLGTKIEKDFQKLKQKDDDKQTAIKRRSDLKKFAKQMYAVKDIFR